MQKTLRFDHPPESGISLTAAAIDAAYTDWWEDTPEENVEYVVTACNYLAEETYAITLIPTDAYSQEGKMPQLYSMRWIMTKLMQDAEGSWELNDG